MKKILNYYIKELILTRYNYYFFLILNNHPLCGYGLVNRTTRKYKSCTLINFILKISEII